MDFFAAQERSRQKSRRLILAFVLAMLGVTAVMYLLASAAVMLIIYARSGQFHPLWSGRLFFWVNAVVVGFLAVAAFFRTMQISRRGGTLIAVQLGGRWIARNTAVLEERRLLNVTDEMAVAAGLPAPVAYVLDDQPGLNAFAAGLSPQDGVVCVTRGLLDAMNREELQGVIGHEVSHIANGDSRINLRLAGALCGFHILAAVGGELLDDSIARMNSGRDLRGFLVGLPLFTVGAVGRLFGTIIQSAVSREREYLADASSAQFTRNPFGLASALKKLLIHGSRVRHPEAASVSHFFFSASGAPTFLSGVFATHPPLTDRILRLGGGRLPAVPPSGSRPSAPTDAPAAALAGPRGGIPPANVALARRLLAEFPKSLRQRARTVEGAAGVVAGLFFSEHADIRQRQEGMIPPSALPVARELRQWLSAQPDQGARSRLVWLDLALPVLREAPEPEWRRLFSMAESLIRADGRVGAGEFALYSLLRSVLRTPPERRAKRGQLRLERLDKDISDVLALISRAGGKDGNAAEAAYRAAMEISPARTRLPLPEASTLSPDSVSRALAHLALASPKYRESILGACAAAVRHDGEIAPVERELLRAFAQSLDCPAPPVDDGV